MAHFYISVYTFQVQISGSTNLHTNLLSSADHLFYSSVFALESSIIDSVGFVYSFIRAGLVCTFIQIASLTVYATINAGMIKIFGS